MAVRRAAPFDPAFIERHPLLWPLNRAARALDAFDDFPPLEALALVFARTDGEPPVRFVHASPRRRRGERVDPRRLYDARISLDGEVPTRERCWHDLMNALVWGTFPRAKLALHLRQHQAIGERLTPGAHTLPATRSRELDALALIDEGGVVLLPPCGSHGGSRPDGGRGAVFHLEFASGAPQAVVFGHAIYESLVLGVKPAVVAGVVVEPEAAETNPLRALDRGLARLLEDRTILRSPQEFVRVDLGPFERRPSTGFTAPM